MYLATGDSFRSVAFGFRVGASTVAGIVHEVCAAIWTSLLADYMPRPDAVEWRKIAAEFSHLAFPNCLGAMDGKHVVIEAPPSTGSLYYNYKGTFSIVLLAVVDAKYRFRVVDIGAYGQGRNQRFESGGDIFKRGEQRLGAHCRPQPLVLPCVRTPWGFLQTPLSQAQNILGQCHVFLADEAFPLRRNIMRPYPGHNTGEKNVFNFRLSHVRRMVECAFGILASQWRVYRRVLGVSPEVAENIVKATCMLHNFLRWDGNTGLPGGASSEPSLGLQSAPRFGTNNATRDAVAVREKFAAYFMSPAGRVHWQDR
ncbi:Protein ALP1-like [Merluccius polli]|uniref:Protein ALP1-like n=1 Tax=Merluccius polli TaxID=89951 RepID=A0AA47MHF7_MERPO|nr:Protein ALP1-like [Merluccius polli]